MQCKQLCKCILYIILSPAVLVIFCLGFMANWHVGIVLLFVVIPLLPTVVDTACFKHSSFAIFSVTASLFCYNTGEMLINCYFCIIEKMNERTKAQEETKNG